MALASKKAADTAQEEAAVPGEARGTRSSSEKVELASVHRMASTESLPQTLTRTNIEWQGHPFTRGAYPIQTPSVQRLFARAEMIVGNSISGYYFKAAHGDGVTEALRALREMFEATFDGLRTVLHSFDAKRTEGLRDVCLAIQQSVTGAYVTGRTEDIKAKLVIRFADEAHQSSSKTVLLLLDNLQFIDELDVGLLSSLRHAVHNDEDGMKLVIFGGGHDPGMSNIPKKIKESGFAPEVWEQVVGIEIPFTGISSLDDIREIFDSIDNEQHDGMSWTSFFLPKAAGRDFVLADDAEIFMKALDALAKKNVPSMLAVGIPLRVLLDAVRIFFSYASKVDSNTLNKDERFKMWCDAIQFVHLIRVVNGKAKAQIVNGISHGSR